MCCELVPGVRTVSLPISYDYIVVGGGSAGCVVAGRLVQEFGAHVLLLEAGTGDSSPLISMPAGSFKMMFGGSPAIKRYQTIEQRTLGGRRYSFPQGNVLGGGSSVNVDRKSTRLNSSH